MKILFLHRNFPAQFKHLAYELAKDKNSEVVFITAREEFSIEGVKKFVYKVKEPKNDIHPFLSFTQEALIHGQQAANVAIKLKEQGFIPDIVYGHTWGQTLFMKDVFPEAKLVCHFEWFYNSENSDVDFISSIPVNRNKKAEIRIKNSHLLVDLYSCDYGISPTNWQKEQFPKEFHHKIAVIHEGIDTDFFKPDPNSKIVLPHINLDLSDIKEIITYVSRGLEPYRGFPQFMETVKVIQQRRPDAHIVIVGEDNVFYGRKLPNNKTYKQLMLEKLPDLDLSRLHFTGRLPYDLYLKVIQASSVHVYLTYPFVLSWSLLESLSTGCAVVASDTQSVKEVIQNGVNGLLANFFSPNDIADKVDEILNNPDKYVPMRQSARDTVLQNYALKDLLPKQINFLTSLMNKEVSLAN